MTCWGLQAYEGAELALRPGSSVPIPSPWVGMGSVGKAINEARQGMTKRREMRMQVMLYLSEI